MCYCIYTMVTTSVTYRNRKNRRENYIYECGRYPGTTAAISAQTVTRLIEGRVLNLSARRTMPLGGLPTEAGARATPSTKTRRTRPLVARDCALSRANI